MKLVYLNNFSNRVELEFYFLSCVHSCLISEVSFTLPNIMVEYYHILDNFQILVSFSGQHSLVRRSTEQTGQPLLKIFRHESVVGCIELSFWNICALSDFGTSRGRDCCLVDKDI